MDDAVARGEIVVASGRWALTGPGSDGAPHRYEGNWLNLLQPGAERWRILVHMWN